MQEVCARRPAVRFDLPYTVEHGKYVVVLGTPAGPRRFIFDTGASGTCISESLRDELGAEIVKTQKVRDFEGHVVPIDCTGQTTGASSAHRPYESSSLTLAEISLPSARPASFFVTTPITLPICVTDVAPTWAITALTSASSSSGVSCRGRNSW